MLLRRAFTLRPQASRLVRTMASAPNNFGVPSASELMQDSELAAMPAEVKAKYAGPASDDAIERTRKGLEQFKHTVEVVDKPADALASILKIVPAGVDVTSVGSTTLREIGYLDMSIKGELPFTDIRGLMFANKDPSKQREIVGRRLTSAYTLASAPAVSETGEIVLVDASGTKIGPILTTDKVIFIVGSNKITATYEEALQRSREWAYTVESARCRAVYKNAGASFNNLSVMRAQMTPRVHVIIVKEPLGY